MSVTPLAVVITTTGSLHEMLSLGINGVTLFSDDTSSVFSAISL